MDGSDDVLEPIENSDVSDEERVTDEEEEDGGGGAVVLRAMDSSSTDENEQDGEMFDPCLPIKHSYLGSDLEELHGRTVLEDDSLASIPLLPQSGVVLVPGQTLPLTIFQPQTAAMMRRVISGDRTFGIVSVRYPPPSFFPKPVDIGTTAEVYEFREETENEAGLRVKAKGRQRFRVVDTRRQVDGTIVARVKIMPDVVLDDPLAEIRVATMDRFALRTSGDVKKQIRRRNAHVTAWPGWVYDQYDAALLSSRVRSALQEQGSGRANKGQHRGKQSPTPHTDDPLELSYWAAQYLPLDDDQRLALLRINSPIQRLRYELSVWGKCKTLCCQGCRRQVANHTDVFSMSVEGPLGTYCNPGGYVHDTFTLHRAKGLVLSGGAQTEFSWFPGYAWTVADCGNCHSHVGWKFTATKKKLKPEKFWGLCRKALVTGINRSDRTGWMRPVI